MKKLLIGLFVMVSLISVAQPSGNCLTCPPSGVGNDGKVLGSNGGKKPVWVTGGSSGAWSLIGNANTTSANYLGTTDGQPLYVKSDSLISLSVGDSIYLKMGKSIRTFEGNLLPGYKLESNPLAGVYGGVYTVNQQVEGKASPYTVVYYHDSILGATSVIELGRGQIEGEVTDDEGNVGNFKVTAYGFNAGPYQKPSWFNTDWQAGYFYLGSLGDHQATIYGDTVTSKLTAASDSGFVIKNVPNSSDLGQSDSLTIKLNGLAYISTNLPAIQFGNAITYYSADSATIYATTPAPGTTYYCSNCTGSGVTGRIVSYIGSLWRRMKFD